MNAIAILAGIALLFSSALCAEDSATWEFTAEANVYALPDETYLNPVITADKNRLHLEARYNDEDLDTGSIFAGVNFHTGETVELTVTPLLGGVFGNTNGIAPGFAFELNYRKLSFSSEGEYLFSTDEKESSFFYSWSEFVYSPADWMWFGLAGQRTRAYRTELEIQRGILLGFGAGNFAVTGYVMNPGWDDAFAVVTVEYSF